MLQPLSKGNPLWLPVLPVRRARKEQGPTPG